MAITPCLPANSARKKARRHARAPGVRFLR
jgi:hypothetical protein